MSNLARTTRKSTWTPLSNEEANQKIFDERRGLTVKWFEKWTDQQRKIVLKDVIQLCKGKQIDYIADVLNEKKPVYKDDFTRVLPRVLTLYILSFLDPRSLCRAAQVSWYWKYITELDHLWMPKCVGLGWILPFSPSAYENGVWKRLYIENIVALKGMFPKKKKTNLFTNLEELHVSEDTHNQSSRSQGRLSRGTASKRPPWRGSDPNPQDMWRNNYLDNDDDVKKVNAMRQKHLYGPMAEDIIRKAKNKVRTGEHAAMIKAMHMEGRVTQPYNEYVVGERPNWAQTGPYTAPFMDRTLVKSIPDANKRPSPSTTTAEISKAMKQRSNRSPPSKPLFKKTEHSTWDVHIPETGQRVDT